MNTTTIQKLFPESERRRKAGTAIMKKVRAAYPDCYYTAGVGWCGPEFESAAAMERALRTDAGL